MPLLDAKDCFHFIRSMEGLDQPFLWPGGESGVTVGFGYDLGYASEPQFRRDWSPHLAPDVMDRLAQACGVRGDAARQIAHTFAGIRITPSAADAVLIAATLPAEIRKTVTIYPRLGALPIPAQVALTSLVYNRGTSLVGPRRTEMRDLVGVVGRGDLYAIGVLLRSMKRLWPDCPGLVRRREAEAALVDGCLPAPEAPQ